MLFDLDGTLYRQGPLAAADGARACGAAAGRLRRWRRGACGASVPTAARRSSCALRARSNSRAGAGSARGIATPACPAPKSQALVDEWMHDGR